MFMNHGARAVLVATLVGMFTVSAAQGAGVRPAGHSPGVPEGLTVTAVADGRLLVFGGGSAQSRALRSTEIYDPAHDAWTRGPELIEARWDHEAPLLGDGSVLVAGGWVREQHPASGVETWIVSDRAWRTAGNTTRSLRDSHVVPLYRCQATCFCRSW